MVPAFRLQIEIVKNVFSLVVDSCSSCFLPTIEVAEVG